MEQMNALGFRHYGGADVLEQLNVPCPTLQDDGVLIRVAAAGVNPADWRLRNGQFRFFIKSPFPFIPGADVAGVVEEVGSAVTRFHAGDAVYAMLPIATGGGYAEYVAVNEQAVYSLADAAEAHRYSETERVRGKLVLVVDVQLATMQAGSEAAGIERPQNIIPA